MNRLLTSIAAVGLLGGAVARADAPAATSTGITAPSDVRKIGFEVRGVVSKVSVKKNDIVKAGQPLIELQDAKEQATLAGAKLAADPTLQVAEATQTFELKKIDYERKKSMFDQGNVASDFEVRQAETEMNIAKIRIDLAKHEAAQKQAEADAQAALIAEKHRMVPSDFPEGQVSDVAVKEGEQVDESRPALELVDLDPLYVNMGFVNTAVVQRLKLGDTLKVKYSDESTWREAVVDAIDPSANTASGMHPFRLKLPNPEMRVAGLRVEVQLPTAAVASGN